MVFSLYINILERFTKLATSSWKVSVTFLAGSLRPPSQSHRRVLAGDEGQDWRWPVFSRSASALPAHAPRTHGPSRATNICVSLVADSASNLVGAAFTSTHAHGYHYHLHGRAACRVFPLVPSVPPEACLQIQGAHRRFHIIVHNMRIDHRGGEMRMAQGLLHQADILGGAVELGGIGVPEHMRMHVFANPGFASPSLHHLAQRRAVDARPLEGGKAVGGGGRALAPGAQ